MLTLPWRKKEEGFQWVQHEKTKIRMRREERAEHLSAMGYFVRICTSLLGLKLWALLELLLLKAARAKTKTASWLSGQLPSHLSSFFNKTGAAFSAFWRTSGAVTFGLWRAIKAVSIALWRVISNGSKAVLIGFIWFVKKVDRAIYAIGTQTLSGTKASFKAIKTLLQNVWPQLQHAARSMLGLGEASRDLTIVISRKLYNQRQTVAYTALTLAIFGGILSAVSMGVFSQLPDQKNIIGTARVIDADLIKVGDQDVRLYGVDAPEPTQKCRRNAHGRSNWGCGRKAVVQLGRLLNGNDVNCIRKGTDNLGRIIAQCYAGKWDIAAYMIREGLAWVAPGDPANYLKFENKAKSSGVGIWRAKSDTPWHYREVRWTRAKANAPEGCPVKGNISSAGRVYYLPWSNKYDRVHIQPKKGERWFCNEREAIQAGWRMTRYP